MTVTIIASQANSQDRNMAVKKFFIFGQGISFSMSPTIHTAAFKHHGLPHTYTIFQTQTVDELSSLIHGSSFGGSSVTMPHKLSVGKFCDVISEDAQRIGAINTLIVSGEHGTREGKILGENTDWSGLAECLKNKGEGIAESAEAGLVIGAGGASRAAVYALLKTGTKNIYLFNRTRATAEKIAADYASLFRIHVVGSLSEVKDLIPPSIIIGTIPADKTTEEHFPQELFERSTGICVDMSYKPRSTPLLRQAETHQGWKTVTGLEVLLEQAFVQSQLWLGLPAPKEIMTEELEKAEALKNEAISAGRL